MRLIACITCLTQSHTLFTSFFGPVILTLLSFCSLDRGLLHLLISCVDRLALVHVEEGKKRGSRKLSGRSILWHFSNIMVFSNVLAIFTQQKCCTLCAKNFCFYCTIDHFRKTEIRRLLNGFQT